MSSQNFSRASPTLCLGIAAAQFLLLTVALAIDDPPSGAAGGVRVFPAGTVQWSRNGAVTENFEGGAEDESWPSPPPEEDNFDDIGTTKLDSGVATLDIGGQTGQPDDASDPKRWRSYSYSHGSGSGKRDVYVLNGRNEFTTVAEKPEEQLQCGIQSEIGSFTTGGQPEPAMLSLPPYNWVSTNITAGIKAGEDKTLVRFMPSAEQESAAWDVNEGRQSMRKLRRASRKKSASQFSDPVDKQGSQFAAHVQLNCDANRVIGVILDAFGRWAGERDITFDPEGKTVKGMKLLIESVYYFRTRTRRQIKRFWKWTKALGRRCRRSNSFNLAVYNYLEDFKNDMYDGDRRRVCNLLQRDLQLQSKEEDKKKNKGSMESVNLNENY